MLRGSDPVPPRLGNGAKAILAARVWYAYFVVQLGIRRTRLPELVSRLGAESGGGPRYAPALLSRAVDRSLHVGPYRPRCLIGALVLFRLLRLQGDPAELVIGLPQVARTRDAHAWVELHGLDVGPPPGRGRHVQLARFS